MLYCIKRAVGACSDVESVGGRGRLSRPRRQEVTQSKASLSFLPAGSEHWGPARNRSSPLCRSSLGFFGLVLFIHSCRRNGEESELPSLNHARFCLEMLFLTASDSRKYSWKCGYFSVTRCNMIKQEEM